MIEFIDTGIEDAMMQLATRCRSAIDHSEWSSRGAFTSGYFVRDQAPPRPRLIVEADGDGMHRKETGMNQNLITARQNLKQIRSEQLPKLRQSDPANEEIAKTIGLMLTTMEHLAAAIEAQQQGQRFS